MQTLGLSDSTPKTENRLKSLFWPSVQSGADVDYLGIQGYWVCTVVSLLTLFFGILSDHPIAAMFAFLLLYFSGIGVRERSWFAAAVVFLFLLTDTIVSGPGIVRIIMLALLFSNVRATWIASQWQRQAEEAQLPPRMSDTWSDKFADQLPTAIWPKIRIPYYIFAILMLSLTEVGAALMLARRVH